MEATQAAETGQGPRAGTAGLGGKAMRSVGRMGGADHSRVVVPTGDIAYGLPLPSAECIDLRERALHALPAAACTAVIRPVV